MNKTDVADYDTVKDDIAALKKQVGELLEHARTAAAGGAEVLYSDLKRRSEVPLQSFTERVKKQPVESVAVALAVGYLLGRLTQSSRG